MAGARAATHPFIMNERSIREAFQKGPHDRIAAGPGALAYWRFGSGPDVVLVHGWPLHGATFRRIIPLLAERYTLHVFDMPGVGQSDWPSHAPRGLGAYAWALRAALDTLGLGPYAFLAHDSGGAVARIVAADDPRVVGLALGNTEIPGHRPWQVEAYVRVARLGLAPLFRRAMGIPFVRRGPLAFGGCFTDPRYVEGDFGDLFVRPFVAEDATYRGQMALVETFDFGLIDGLADLHRRTTAPALLVWGTEDPFFPLAKARAMLDQFGGEASLVEIPRAKLFAHEDHPEAFVARVEPFLARCHVGGLSSTSQPHPHRSASNFEVLA